jgi:hypothetical protein
VSDKRDRPTGADLHDLVVTYWAYYRARCAGDENAAEELWWAWDRVDAIGVGRSAAGSVEPVSLLAALAEDAGDDPESLAFLGAGPVEDYLKSDRFDRARFDRAVAASDRLRRAVGYAR